MNFSRHSRAHLGSSVQLTHVVTTSGWSYFNSWRIFWISPRSRTFVPARSVRVLTTFFPAAARKGEPPPHNSYISGDQTVPSRSKATSLGNTMALADRIAKVVRMQRLVKPMTLRRHGFGTFCQSRTKRLHDPLPTQIWVDSTQPIFGYPTQPRFGYPTLPIFGYPTQPLCNGCPLLSIQYPVAS